MLDHPHGKNFFPNVQPEPPLAALCHCHTLRHQHQEESPSASPSLLYLRCNTRHFALLLCNVVFDCPTFQHSQISLQGFPFLQTVKSTYQIYSISEFAEDVLLSYIWTLTKVLYKISAGIESWGAQLVISQQLDVVYSLQHLVHLHCNQSCIAIWEAEAKKPKRNMRWGSHNPEDIVSKYPFWLDLNSQKRKILLIHKWLLKA